MKAEKALPEVPDEDLMVQVAAGDRKAFQILAQRHMKLLYAVAYRMFPQRADAEDIVQEALLRIWSKAHLWRAGAGAAVSTWIYRLAYNLCIDHKRKGFAAVPLDENSADGAAGPERILQKAQTGAIVGEALQRLPERQRAALVLCHYQGLSNAEAAAIMGTSVKGVEGLLVRARQALQKDLARYKGVL